MECRGCGHANRANARFCEACGQPLGTTARAQPEPVGALPDGERKQVTVLFADVMGSMDLAEAQDPEAWRAIMDRFFSLLADGVRRYDGTVDKFTGDGIMALFGAPVAMEDHALRACYSVLHLQQELAAYADELRRTQGVSFSVRFGLHSGEVVAGSLGEGWTAIGHTVGLAQRMESLAEPNSAYLTATTASLVEGLVELRDLGEFAVRGASAPVGVHQLVGARSGSRLQRSLQRGFSVFVGRREEMGVLEAALERAQAGEGAIVGVVADAGVGKSRLCHELAERAAARGLYVYRAAAFAHMRAPFQAALDLLRDYFAIDVRDDDRATREKIAGRLLLLDDAFASDLALLFDFMGVPDPRAGVERMDPEARARRLMELCTRMLRAQSDVQPGVVIVEDLHWIDPASAQMLAALAHMVPLTRTLMVVNYRPEFDAEWTRLAHFKHLHLSPLGNGAAEELLEGLLGRHPSLDGLAEQLRERTGGNPFFIEETVRTLAEDGTLEGRRGAYELARPVEAISVPPSVQTILAARIDRLAPEPKALLARAAVIGREFSLGLLERVAGGEGELTAALDALVRADFLVRQAEFPEPEFAFRHPLTQEVAYGTQLAEGRRVGHAAVARALIELGGEDLDERASVIAHHFEVAGATLDAARWHARAGLRVGVHDPAGASSHWRRVRELTDSIGDDAEAGTLGATARALELQLGWRVGLTHEEAQALYEEGCVLADALGNPALRAMLTTTYAAHHGLSGDMTASERILGEIPDVGEHLDAAMALPIWQYAAYQLFSRARLDEAIELLDRYVELARDVGPNAQGVGAASPLAFGHFLRGLVESARGNLELAAAESERSLEIAREHDDEETQTWAANTQIWVTMLRGEGPDPLAKGRRAMEIADRMASPFCQVWSTFYLGIAHGLAGERVEEARLIRIALELAVERRTGMEGRALMLAHLALSRLAVGDLPGADEASAEALECAERSGARGGRLVAIGARARTLAARADFAAAEELVARGVDEALFYGARTLAADLLGARVELELARDGRPSSASVREAAAAWERVGAPARAVAVEALLASPAG